MKKLYLLLALITASPFCANAQSNNGLLAHWDFSPLGIVNPSVPDVSGNGFNGTLYDIAFVAGQTGKPNTAALFNGTSSYITTAYQSKLNITQYSICTQIKVNGFYTGICQANMILNRGAWPTIGSFGLQFYDNAYDKNCNTHDTNKYVFSALAGNAGPANEADWIHTPSVHTNKWYNVIATFDGSVFKIYIDGQLANTATVSSGAIGTSTIPMTIGRNLQNGTTFPYWFNGVMDDLRVYDRVLTNDEIEDYYDDVYISQKVDTLCVDKAFNLNYTTIGTYPSGNIFTAQLSDATGSFASPTIIGNTTAQTSGIISCFIPSGLTSNTGYRIRIISSTHNDISEDALIAYIHLGNAATASITASPNSNVGPYTSVLFSSNITNAGNNPGYQWRKNGVNIQGATNSTYTAVSAVDFNSNDNISLFVTGNIACTDQDTATSNTISTNVNLSVNSLNATDNIKISPNPSNGVFTISGKVDATETLQIEVFNTLGQQVYHNYIQTANGILNQTIELPNLPSGPYKMRLKAGVESKLLPIQIQ
ncbi:MAG: LamG-like jellyroll fold domain-containing protein [Flavipsychrobacter sp.]